MDSPGHVRGKSSGGGSVRRARERMQAGSPSEIPSPPKSTKKLSALEGPRPAPPPPSGPRPILKNAIPQNSQPPIGMAISRPTPAPQWPLPPGPRDDQVDKFVGDKEYQPPPGRAIPPQRPPRPSHVPSILDASKLQEHTASFPYIPQQRAAAQAASQQQLDPPRFPDESLLSPVDSNNLKSPQSRPSTISSVGTIPDFPIPAIPPPVIPVRKSTLGPPPSSRRGASSYYSQASFVSPIPEESDRSRSHGSYASSAAIPSSWGSASPVPYYEGEVSPGLSDTYSDFEIIDERPDNRPESRSDDGDESGLVRKASLGKRGKPSLISTRSSERMEPLTPGSLGIPEPMPANKLAKMGVFGQAEMKAAIANASTPQVVINDQRHTKWPSVDNTNPPSTTPSLERANTQSSETVPTLHTTRPSNDAPPMPLMPPAIGLARADSTTMGSEELRPPMQQRESSRFSRLSALRRPPRLNLDAVREAEARGSLTSLPDLIKRATRLAAMMDNGKRPGSRMVDLNDFPSDMESGDEKGFGDTNKRRSGLSMLSDILSAFPPPGLGTPRNQSPRGPRPTSPWPQGFNGSPLAYAEEQDGKNKKKKGKRCCGMSLCCFLILLLIILILIAAAVVIPLELLVFNKHKSTKTSSATSAASSISACEAALTCYNGGTNSITSGVCSCICTNGFTGSTCAVESSVGCTSANFTDVSNVTIGEAIPRLISASQTNFSIPLTSNVIISRFNSDNLSCTSENALVTFDGEDQRFGSSSDTVSSSASSTTTAASKAKRTEDFYVTNSFSGAAKATSTSSTTSAHAVATSNGIIFDPTTTSGSATSTASSAQASATFAVTEEVLDFARVAVLYVLEKKSVDVAVTAQTQLQSFFTDGGSNSDAQNVTIGTGFTINLVGLSIDLGNGTVGGTGKTVSRRSRILK